MNLCTLSLRALFFFMLLGVGVRAQTVSGYIRDAATGETLIQANVIVKGKTLGATTNTAGYYTLPNLPEGDLVLVYSYIGYKRQEQVLNLKKGENRTLNVELLPESTDLDEVEVVAEDEDVSERAAGVTKLDVATITRLPSVLQADVFRSLQLLPGIKSSSDFSSGLYIRGGSPDQTLIQLDRTTVYNPTHVFGFFSTFNPDTIKDVRLYKGVYPAEYGGRLGSVVDIYNKDGNAKGNHGVLSLGLLSSRASMEGPYKFGSWMVGVRRSTTEPVLKVLNETYPDAPDKFYFYDGNAKINFNIDTKNKLFVTGYAGQDVLSSALDESSNVYLKYGNLTGSLNWTHIFSPKVFSALTFTASRYFSMPTATFATTNFSRDNNVREISAKADIEYSPNQQHRVEGGLSVGRMKIGLYDTFNGVQTNAFDLGAVYAAAYVQEKFEPNEHWQFKGGLRLNYWDEGQITKVEPRLSADYIYSPTLKFQAAYGRYSQFLSLITNEAFSGFDVWVTAQDGVKPSYGDQFVLGVKTKPFLGWNFDVEGYYRTMKDLFELDPFLPDAAGLPYNRLFRYGDGFAYGTEFFLEKAIGKLNGFVGYTFGVTKRRFPNFNNNEFYTPKHDRTHDVQFVANYNLSKKWLATATWNYATGQAYTEPSGRTYITNPFGQSPFINIGGDVLVVGELNGSRFPAYHRLDIGFTRNGKAFKKYASELQLQIINAYNRKNIWFYRFDFDQNPVQKLRTNQLPILPNIAYTIKF